MNIVIVSKSWPSYEKSGVSLTSWVHANLLSAMGHSVHIVGSDPKVLLHKDPKINAHFIDASGSGALYSPARINKSDVDNLLMRLKPDLVILEAWQTSITNNFLNRAKLLAIPVMFISHGISLHPFKKNFFGYLRSFLWWPYYISLRRQIQKITLLCVLDLYSRSERFYDRKLACENKIPVSRIRNLPINTNASIKSRAERLNQIIVIGYFSYIKNQLEAIELLISLPSDLKMIFIGKKNGAYYQKCVEKVNNLGLNEKVQFLEDDECDLAEMISSSLAVLSISITEVVPLNLIEAMALKTPFVARDVGAVSSLSSGVLETDSDGIKKAILRLIEDEEYWCWIAYQGFYKSKTEFSIKNLKEDIVSALNSINSEARE